jgi:hypothetical protein
LKTGLFLENILSKSLRPFLSEAVSRSRLSPAGFRDMAMRLSSEFPGRVHFVKGDEWATSKVSPDMHFPSIFMIGDSDLDWQARDFPDWPGATFFVQNLSDGETKSVKILPIGVEDYRWARNGMPWNFRQSFRLAPKSATVLVGPFGRTHFSREKLTSQFVGMENVHVIESRVASWRYAKVASRYGYVLCPRGNGLDTHRFWEALYRGSVPVVLESQWSLALQSYGVPVVSLKSWTDLENATLTERTRESINYLNPQWWESRFREILQTR